MAEAEGNGFDLLEDDSEDDNFSLNSSINEKSLLGEDDSSAMEAQHEDRVGSLSNADRKRGRESDNILQPDNKIPKPDTISSDITANCEAGLDVQEGRLSQPMRGYQLEVSENVLRGDNDIIILPTGTGKTLIASNLIQKHLCSRRASENEAKVLFLAPRKVLVTQQLDAIRGHLEDEWKEQCRSLTAGDYGSMDMLEALLTGTEYKVIVATPQIIVNYFTAFKSSTMKKFSLIIFDECHNARENDPYGVLLNQYMDERFAAATPQDERFAATMPQDASQLPQLVGLTATIGIGKSKGKEDAKDYMLSFCSRMFLTHKPKEIIENQDELQEYIDPPLSATVIVETARSDPFSEQLREIMKRIIEGVKGKMRDCPALKPVLDKFKPTKEMLNLSLVQRTSEAIESLKSAHDQAGEVAKECIISLKHLQVYHTALTHANLARLSDAMAYLKEEIVKPEMRNCDYHQLFEDNWNTELQEKANSEDNSHPNPKLSQLKEELDKILESEEKRIDDNFRSKVIIFVENRRLTAMISDWLKSLGEKYRSERFVSSQISNDKHGMSSAESADVMERFRTGELNILVATSVLSEGVDIQECNGVIRYMYMKDVIAEVQVPGRVRSKDGRVVGILDDKLKKQYVENTAKEKWMREGLKKIREISSKEFATKMVELQKKEYKQRRLSRESGQKKKESLNLNKEAEVVCSQCGRSLGVSSSIYCYMKCHYIVLDAHLTEKVTVKWLNKSHFTDLFDGLTETGRLVCSGTDGTGSKCSANLGHVQRIKINKETKYLASWDVKEIQFKLAGVNKPLRGKWSEVKSKVLIADIQQETLRELVEEGKSLTVDE